MKSADFLLQINIISLWAFSCSSQPPSCHPHKLCPPERGVKRVGVCVRRKAQMRKLFQPLWVACPFKSCCIWSVYSLGLFFSCFCLLLRVIVWGAPHMIVFVCKISHESQCASWCNSQKVIIGCRYLHLIKVLEIIYFQDGRQLTNKNTKVALIPSVLKMLT